MSLLFTYFERSGSISWITDKVYKTIGNHTMVISLVGCYVFGLFILTVAAVATATITLLVPNTAALGRRMTNIFLSVRWLLM